MAAGWLLGNPICQCVRACVGVVVRRRWRGGVGEDADLEASFSAASDSVNDRPKMSTVRHCLPVFYLGVVCFLVEPLLCPLDPFDYEKLEREMFFEYVPRCYLVVHFDSSYTQIGPRCRPPLTRYFSFHFRVGSSLCFA